MPNWAKNKSPLILMKLGDLLEHVLTKKDLEFRQKNRSGRASATGKTVLSFCARNSLGPLGVLNGFFYGFLQVFMAFLRVLRGVFLRLKGFHNRSKKV